MSAALATTAAASPWRSRGKSFSAETPEFVPKSFSAEAPEFKPKSFSTGACEFVPSWKKENEVTAAAHCCISLGAYSDDSSEEEEKAAPLAPLQMSTDACEFVPSWKKEQVLAATAPSYGYCGMISLDAYSDDSDDDEIQPAVAPTSTTAAAEIVAEASVSRPWRTTSGVIDVEAAVPDKPISTSSPWRRNTLPAPTLEVSDMLTDSNCLTPTKSGLRSTTSMSTLSTAASSPSTAESVDDGMSSTTVSSRAHSPAPFTPESDAAMPLTLHSLLQWRHIASSADKEVQLPTAAEPDAGTPEAAVAAYVAAMVANPPAPSSSEMRTKATPSWRQAQEQNAKPKDVQEETMWRDVKPAAQLAVSEDSFVGRQRARRSTVSGGAMSDEEVVRTMKSILNKLTLEKFESLSAQLVQCGIKTATHFEMLIHEVFEKATTQHHFIDMYADLCVFLNEQKVLDDPNMKFKKILLNCCQASFEKNLTPPVGLAKLEGEDRIAAERTYKMRMLGNIRFVGALLVRKMLASKVMLSIMEELLQEPTSEALESLASLLMVVGPTFDTPDWSYRATLNAIFKQVEKHSKNDSVASRIRCLLKDVLDVRNQGWTDRRPKQLEGPSKLDQVAAKAANETNWVATGNSSVFQKAAPCSNNDWEVAGARSGKVPSYKTATPYPTAFANSKQQDSVVTPQKPEAEKTVKNLGSGSAMLDFLKTRDAPKKETVSEFDSDACKVEVSKVLAELRVSHDVSEAIARMAGIAVPVAHQSSQFCDILSSLVEEGSSATRKVGFSVVVGLFLEKHWKPESAKQGLRSLAQETFPDLKCDVPTLPAILRDELHPAFAPLVKANLLDAEQHSAMLCI